MSTIVDIRRLKVKTKLKLCSQFSFAHPNELCKYIQGDSKRWTQSKSKRRLNFTPDSWLRHFKFSAHSTCWFVWDTLKTFLNSSHVLLWYMWTAWALAFTQTAYLLILVIPTTNARPRWRLNVETKTKRTLHSSRRLSFNELKNAKNPVLPSSHFAVNWRCYTALH